MGSVSVEPPLRLEQPSDEGIFTAAFVSSALASKSLEPPQMVATGARVDEGGQEGQSRSLERAKEYRLFLIDASDSMGNQLQGVPRIEVAREGVRRFLTESMPLFYPDWPLSVGVTVFAGKGAGPNHPREIVPILMSPTTAQRDRIEKLRSGGRTPLIEALQSAENSMTRVAELDRFRKTAKRIKLITDGGNTGPSPSALCAKLAESGVIVDGIELAEKPSEFVAELAERGGGIHHCVKNIHELMEALELPRRGPQPTPNGLTV